MAFLGHPGPSTAGIRGLDLCPCLQRWTAERESSPVGRNEPCHEHDKAPTIAWAVGALCLVSR